jgi:uncharacterized protein YukE
MNAPDDYNRHRYRETYGERHPRTDREDALVRKHRVQKQNNRLPGHFGKANWEAYQHYELYNMIMKAEPKQMYRRADDWKELSGAIDRTTSEIQKVMEQAMGVWQGQAAVNAGASTTRLMQWAGTASHTAGTVAARMSDYTDAVATAQRRMPDPAFATSEQRFRDGYTVMTTGGPADAVFLKQLTSDGMVGHQEARARKAEAVAVMESYESHSKGVHEEMPHFTDAGPTTKDAPAWTPTTTDPGGGGAGGGGGSGSGGGLLPGGGTAGVPTGNGSTSAAGFVDPLTVGANGPGGSGGPGSTSFGGGPGSLNGNAGADALRSGSGFGAGGLGGGTGNSAGVMGPGGLAGRGPGGVIGGAGGLAAGGAGARGAGAFGGMPLGGGANGEEDGEHTNKYDEGLDLFDDLPPAYPPVFGA